MCGVKEWKEVPYKEVPKKGIHKDDIANQRYIGKQSHAQQWYLKVVRDRIRRRTVHRQVSSYGFKPGRMTSDITGLLRQLVHVAAEYGSQLWIADMDVQTAFDEMRRQDIADALRNNGAQLIDIFATMRGFLGAIVSLELPGKVHIDPTPVEKQGFKAVSIYLISGTW